MADAEAKIRPYNHAEDDKLFRFMLGKSRMEPLAVSNKLIYKSPIGIAIWIAVSSALVQMMQWYPTGEYGFLGYLRPFPAFAICTLPLMFLVDWYNRTPFEEEAIRVLERPDVVSVQTYYGRSPSSGVWIYEFGPKFVGLVAVDASVDSLSEQTIKEMQPVIPEKKKNNNNNSKKVSATGKKEIETDNDNGKDNKRTSSVAVIRHIYVSEEYRRASAQNDLIKFAVDKTFTSANNVEKIRVTPSPVMKYLSRALKEEGFEVIEKGPSVGVFAWKWTTLTYELTRETWSTGRRS